MAAVIMNDALEARQPMRTLRRKMKPLRKGFSSNQLHDIEEQAGLGDGKKEASSASCSVGILGRFLVRPARAPLSGLS